MSSTACSRPVPFDDLKRRIDRLAKLGTRIITLSVEAPIAAILAHLANMD